MKLYCQGFLFYTEILSQSALFFLSILETFFLNYYIRFQNCVSIQEKPPVASKWKALTNNKTTKIKKCVRDSHGVHIFYPNTRQEEEGKFPKGSRQPGLYREFQVSYIVRPCLKTNQKQKQCMNVPFLVCPGIL